MAEQDNQPPPAEPRRHRVQYWTETGYPIVDNRYINLETETIETIPENGYFPIRVGPPHLRIVWNNMSGGNDTDPFRGMALTGFVSSTEWLRRLGVFLGLTGDELKIESLNVTEYGIYVLSESVLDGVAVMEAMRLTGLCPAKRDIPVPTDTNVNNEN